VQKPPVAGSPKKTLPTTEQSHGYQGSDRLIADHKYQAAQKNMQPHFVVYIYIVYAKNIILGFITS